MTVTDLRVEAVRQHNALSRVRIGEVLFWIGCAAAYFVFPDRHLLMNEMAILGLFALSLDLILGYAGILSLGHAAFFGLGAYTAGIITKYGITDPIAGLGIAALFAAITGFFTSFLVLRGSELTKLMVTLGIALVLQEVANRNGWITGGADGLQGMNIGAVFGETYGFDFDIFGAVANAYSLITLFVLFLIARRIIHSPFGWSLRSLRDNPLRAAAIGIPVNARLVAVYTLAAAYAGIAGALLGWRVGVPPDAGRAVEPDAAILGVLDRPGPGDACPCRPAAHGAQYQRGVCPLPPRPGHAAGARGMTIAS
jgi:branched-chain amino acid transport system permease protein